MLDKVMHKVVKKDKMLNRTNDNKERSASLSCNSMLLVSEKNLKYEKMIDYFHE